MVSLVYLVAGAVHASPMGRSGAWYLVLGCRERKVDILSRYMMHRSSSPYILYNVSV